ncbi:HAD family phosphatase [Candidatus Dojkabacteria bacterium]|nr:HAD family phosphatase [Candidatus Dojkabacteria bacterium]
MNYKGLIFDFNGVLWWDTQIQEEAWQQTAIKLRGREFDNEELGEHLHGRNNKHTLEYLTGKSIETTVELERLTQLKEQNYREKCLSLGAEFKLSPGAIELLDFLKKSQIPITLATASEITNIRFFFENLKLNNWFDIENIIYDDGTRPGKPAPDVYLAAAKLLNIEPVDCVVVEDARSGMQAAVLANIGCLIALGPRDKHEELKQVDGVKFVVSSLDEVIKLGLF